MKKFFNEQFLWTDAIPHAGCAFETAEILITSKEIDTAVAYEWFFASAKLLVDALKNFAEQPLTFSTQQGNILEITANDGRYKMAFVPAEEFPKAPDQNFNESIDVDALVLKEIIDYKGEIEFDSSKPDGNPRKLLDSSIINSLGWESTINLQEGLIRTYSWYKENILR